MYYQLPIGKRYIDADYKIHLLHFLKQLGIIETLFSYENPHGRYYNIKMTMKKRDV